MTVEEWRPIPGVEGYEASRLGHIRSLRRAAPRELRGTVGPCGFHTVTIVFPSGRRCRRVGTLVALAWLGPRPDGTEVRRLDGDTLNDRADNLAYGTPAQVANDHAARARLEEASGADTHCPEGHRYADSWLGAWGHRLCPTCRDERLRTNPNRAENKRRSYARRRAVADSGTEKGLDDAETPRRAVCEDCGVVSSRTGPGPLPKRCPECAQAARLAADRRWYLRKRASEGMEVHSYLAAARPCLDCGAAVEPRAESKRLRTRCGTCHTAARREADRRHRAKRGTSGGASR